MVENNRPIEPRVSIPRSFEDYRVEQRERQLEDLKGLLSFASVSADPAQADGISACAAWLRDHLARIGLEGVRMFETAGNPIVYGEWLNAGADAPTVLVYAHYDVQPAGSQSLWSAPPFAPEIREEAIYARGASDQKGPLFATLCALEALIAVDGGLPCNVKCVIEGEEELRADELEQFVEQNPALLAADVMVNTDGSFIAPGLPSTAVGLRGMVALELTLRTGEVDLHSGMFGGVAPNALMAMAQLLAGLRSPEGRILVDGFYDEVVGATDAELEEWAELPIDADAVRAQAGTISLLDGTGSSVLERQWVEPTLDVVGMWGGFQDEGLKTVIPCRAHAKISCRLVPDQEMEVMVERLTTHLRDHCPAGAEVTFDWTLLGTPPATMSPDHPAVAAAREALSEGFGTDALLTRLGISVPVNEIASRLLGMPAVMLGYSSPTDLVHAPDEHLPLRSFDGGVKTFASFLVNFAATFHAGT
jgi:acetylornithine deacetylase/succinyl-diaminopimelate desuccinylase-like protein